MLAAYDVINLMFGEGVFFIDQAIFTTVSRTFCHKAAQTFIDQRSQG